MTNLFLVFFLSSEALAASKRTLEFRDPKTQERLIVGEEETQQKGPHTVQTTDYFAVPSTNKTIAHEVSEYNTENLQLIGYSFEDYQSGEKSILRLDQGHLQAEYRKNARAETRTSTLPVGKKPLGNASIAVMIERNWAALERGEAVKFDYYVPFKLDTFPFQILQKRSNSEITVAVEPSNWLIRQFVKKAVFVVDAKATPPKVKQFIGPSHIEIKGEANREVMISDQESLHPQ